VLGRSQPASHADPDRVAALGWDLTRRESGGSAVVVRPGALVWVDVRIGSDHPRFDPDVGRGAWWVGEAWCETLAGLGLRDAAVHRGPARKGPFADRVCFAGVAAGEVTVGGRKLVGLAQRRARGEALFQTGCLLDWDPREAVAGLAFGGGEDERAEAAAAVAGVAIGLRCLGIAAAPDAVAALFLKTLTVWEGGA